MNEYFWFWLSCMFGLLAMYYISRAITDKFYNGNSLSEMESYHLGSFEKGWTNRKKDRELKKQ